MCKDLFAIMCIARALYLPKDHDYVRPTCKNLDI